MADVFMSYAKEDQVVSQRLSALLEKSGLTVFNDVEVLVSGQESNKAFTNALRKAKSVVILLSSNTKRSNWVPKEIVSVLEKKNGPLVIPVLLDRGATQNWVWPLVSNRLAIDLTNSWHDPTYSREDLYRVVATIRYALGIRVRNDFEETYEISQKQILMSAGAAAIIFLILGLQFELYLDLTNGAISKQTEILNFLRSPMLSAVLGAIVTILYSKSRK